MCLWRYLIYILSVKMLDRQFVDLFLPAFCGSLFCYVFPTVSGKALSARLAALAAKRNRSRVFPVIRWGAFLDLASGNPADHDGGTDHVGGALLAFRASSGHHNAFRPRIWSGVSLTSRLAPGNDTMVSSSPPDIWRRIASASPRFIKLGLPFRSVHLTHRSLITTSCFPLSITRELGRGDGPSRANNFKLRHYQLSSTSTRCLPPTARATDSAEISPASFSPSVLATVDGTRPGSDSEASSTSHPPSSKSGRR